MDYNLGFTRLHACLTEQAPDLLAILATLEARLRRNQQQERGFGVTAETKSEYAQVIHALNELALEHCGTTFNDLCGGAGESTAQPGTLRAPPPPDTFAGRTIELQKLTEVLLRNQAAAISAAVPGMGGVGKTTLALKLASDLAPHFPGGVIWLEAGYGAGQSDLVDRLARTVGVDLAQEPLVEKRATILQSVLASRGRVLVVLDDLWDIDLGRWAGKVLLPADRVLLVTSRDVALCRALCNHVQRLDVLPEAEALELLTNLLGALGRHEGAARELVTLLDGHPLALEIAARRCDSGVEDLPWLVRKLHAGPTLGELKLPGQESRDTSVEASLALSYGDLEPNLQQRFRALGVFAPAPFDLAGLAAVWEVESVDEAEEIARPLVRRALLAQEPAGDGPVYHQHMLLRGYAWALLAQAGELDAAAGRHIGYYQALSGRQAENWQVAEAFWEQIEMGWQYARRAGPQATVSFYFAVNQFLYRRAHHTMHNEWALMLLQLPAAQLSEKDRVTALTNIGGVYDALGEKQQALVYYEQALMLSRQVGDRAGVAAIFNNIARVYDTLGEKQQALAYYAQALLISRQIGDKAGEAATLNNIGRVYADLGEKQQALELYEQALPLRRQVGNRAGEATTLTNIGGVYADLGKKQQALAYFEQALPLRHQVGDRAGEATTLANIGRVYADLGEKQQALGYFEQALLLFRQVDNRAGEAMTLNNVGAVYVDLEEKQQALAYYEQAFSLLRQVGDRAGEATTLANIGRVYADLGERQQALAYFEQALLLFRQVGNRAGEATTINNIGTVYADLGDKPQALAHYEKALPLLRQVGNRAGEATTLANIGYFYFRQDQPEITVEVLRRAIQLDEEVANVAQEAGHRFNLAVVLQQAFAQTQEAISLLTQSIAILERYQLPLDANGATLTDHKAFLAQLQGSADVQSDALRLDQILRLVQQARKGDRDLAEQLTPFLQELASNPDISAEVQTLAGILLSFLAGANAPDLSYLSAELSEVIRRAFGLPEA